MTLVQHILYTVVCKSILGHRWKLINSSLGKSGGMTEIYICARCGAVRREDDLG